MSSPLIRTGETAIQDTFQKNLEEGLASGGHNQKVMLWNHQHDTLRVDPLTGSPRASVVMGSLQTTSDQSFGVARKNIHVGVFGLVEAIEEINAVAFQRWLDANPQVSITVHDLAKIAASHAASLFEKGYVGAKANSYRMLLAFGEKYAWEKNAAFFGLKGDPRFLDAKDIPGAPAGAPRLYYRPCYTNGETAPPFLDLEPAWIDKVMGALKNQVTRSVFNHIKASMGTGGKRNRHAWIREFPISAAGGQVEYADFALLVNGLPILLVEFKTPENGIKQAVRDFQKKPTYQGAPLCVASDGHGLIMASSMEGNLEAWVHYAGNIADRPSHADPKDPLDSCEYVAKQLLSRPDRLEFFLIHCGSLNEEGVYQVGRSQQYQALAHWSRDLAWTQACNDILEAAGKPLIGVGNRLIRQTQRTGKTHTMIRALHLALGTYPKLVRLGVVMVGEVLILGQIHEDLKAKDIGLADRDLVKVRVETRIQLSSILEQERLPAQRSEGRILLVNMQKISTSDTNTVALPDSRRTLVVVDEGHLAQTGSTADVRDEIFPEASHLLLTATPKDSMSRRYGIKEDFHVLDDFGYGLAQKAGMVCPVMYQRHPYSFKDDPRRIADLTLAISKAMGEDVDGEEVAAAFAQVMRGDIDELDEANDRNSARARSVARALRRQLETEVMQERLDAIVDMLDRYEAGLEKSESGAPIFRPRALAFGRDTESALDLIRFIQEKNGPDASPSQKNVYRGRRFGVDVSNFGKDPGGELRTLASFNPGVSTEEDLKARLKNTDPDVAIDVLIAVGKYTKGYNNDQLVGAVLLRNIAEPSLMNQIYTRPATKRPGKPKGVCLDLAFGLGNVACWNESLRLYDRKFDLDQLYTQEKVNELVVQVGAALARTASTVGLDQKDLADYSQVIAAFETMDEDRRKSDGRQFILAARDAVALIDKMPDSSIYADLRSPLRGLRKSLGQLRSLYPDLVESSDLAADGTLDAGATDQSLGAIIRNALAILDQSSLKALLDIQMGEVFEVAPVVPAAREDALLQARQRRAIRATQTAIETITGAPAKTGEVEKVRPRALRGHSALVDTLNRVLDKLRDDVGNSNRTAQEYADLLSDANMAMKQWTTMVSTNGGELRHFLLAHIEDQISRRAQVLGIDLNSLGISSELDLIFQEAATDMSRDFAAWQKGLTAGQIDQTPKYLAPKWKGRYDEGKSNLTDFLSAASLRQDLHGLSSSDWQLGLLAKCPAAQLRVLLGDAGSDGRLHGFSSLLEHVMQLALEDRAVIIAAQQWSQALVSEQGELMC